MTNPIPVDVTGTIIAGHRRVEAAKSLGMTEVPSIRLGRLTESKRRVLAIADDQLALNAVWDEETPSSLIRDLNVGYCNPDLLGFFSKDLDRYFAGYRSSRAI